jgi:hypothetical protein
MLHGGAAGHLGCYVCNEVGVYSSLYNAVICWKHIEELLGSGQ